MKLNNVFLLFLIISYFVVPSMVLASIKLETNLDIKDYGIVGHVFPVHEISMLEEIASKLKTAEKEGKITKLQEEFTKKVKSKVLRPNKVQNIAKASRNRSWHYDPTYMQETDITDGDGELIVSSGSKVNALNYVEWGAPFIFIDGDDKKQVKWASKQEGDIVLINGAPLTLEQELDRRVFFDQNGILTDRFNIKAVPAVVSQDGLQLLVQEVAI